MVWDMTCVHPYLGAFRSRHTAFYTLSIWEMQCCIQVTFSNFKILWRFVVLYFSHLTQKANSTLAMLSHLIIKQVSTVWLSIIVTCKRKFKPVGAYASNKMHEKWLWNSSSTPSDSSCCGPNLGEPASGTVMDLNSIWSYQEYCHSGSYM